MPNKSEKWIWLTAKAPMVAQIGFLEDVSLPINGYDCFNSGVKKLVDFLCGKPSTALNSFKLIS